MGTSVTFTIEDLQKVVSDALTKDLETVQLVPNVQTTDELTRPAPVGSSPYIMTSWSAVPSTKYYWTYAGIRYLCFQYVLEANTSNYEVGQFQFYSTVDSSAYNGQYVSYFPAITIDKTIIKTIGTTPGVSLAFANDPADVNSIQFEGADITLIPGLITKVKHGLTTGTIVTYANIGGTPPIYQVAPAITAPFVQGQQFVVNRVSDDVFFLAGVTTYISPGTGFHNLVRLYPVGNVQKQSLDRKFCLMFKVTSTTNMVKWPLLKASIIKAFTA